MTRSTTRSRLQDRLRSQLDDPLPLPGKGETALRHRRLMDLGRQDLSLARLAEAHWDAVAILAEAGREPEPGALYGVWAAEIPGKPLRLERNGSGFTLSGPKMFCSGAGLVDRALVTVGGEEHRLIELDTRSKQVRFDASTWHTPAFEFTNTATAVFHAVPVGEEDVVGGQGWYLGRAGFWQGACGPAACWAGGAVGLVEWAAGQRRDDPHTLAHLGAMQAAVWEMRAVLDTAGREIDAAPGDAAAAHVRALTVRHLVEQAATDVLRRLVRAYGPYPLAFVGPVGLQYQELDLYLRQSHAERDLEALGRATRGALQNIG
jgi:alkylation response protein AidB-like acyl-CoA dehydrogenase